MDSATHCTSLHPVTSINFRTEPFTADEIIEYLSPEHTHTLRVYSGELLNDLKFVRKLPALREFSISDAPKLTNIDDLAGLPLTDLALLNLSAEFSFTALDSLPNLTGLALYTHLPWQSLGELPAPGSLTSLRLAAWTGAYLTGVSRWQELQELVINVVPTPEEWQEISTLPRLSELCLSEYDLTRAVPMRTVTDLQLIPGDSDAQIHLVPEIFPGLERIFINGRKTNTIDITSLAQVEGLRISLNYAHDIVGLERFDPDKVHLYPRPRTSDI